MERAGPELAVEEIAGGLGVGPIPRQQQMRNLVPDRRPQHVPIFLDSLLHPAANIVPIRAGSVVGLVKLRDSAERLELREGVVLLDFCTHSVVKIQSRTDRLEQRNDTGRVGTALPALFYRPGSSNGAGGFSPSCHHRCAAADRLV